MILRTIPFLWGIWRAYQKLLLLNKLYHIPKYQQYKKDIILIQNKTVQIFQNYFLEHTVPPVRLSFFYGKQTSTLRSIRYYWLSWISAKVHVFVFVLCMHGQYDIRLA